MIKTHDHSGDITDFSVAGPELVLKKLRSALRADGDFPVRARVVSELRELANNHNTPVHRITDLILREPSLGTRVLHLVNSAFYQRAHPIMTITQAVIQIGMRPLAELCAGLILMQRFISVAKRGGVFSDSLRKTILTSLLTSSLVRDSDEHGLSERAYLAATFYNLGYLLLAYYFPNAYAQAASRAESLEMSVTQSLTEIIGLDGLDLNLIVVDALDIPQYYRDVLVEAYRPFSDRTVSGPNSAIADAIALANEISNIVLASSNAAELMSSLRDLSHMSHYDLDDLTEIVEDLPQEFHEHCRLIEMTFLTLPEYLEHESLNDISSSGEKDFQGQFYRYVAEIKEAIANHEPMSSIISSVMETIAFGLRFDRAVLLLADVSRQSLQGRMALGKEIDPKSIWRTIQGNDLACDTIAFREAKLSTAGTPLLPDGVCFVALPIGTSRGTVGVIYADRVAPASAVLEEDVLHALQILVDLLNQALLSN